MSLVLQNYEFILFMSAIFITIHPLPSAGLNKRVIFSPKAALICLSNSRILLHVCPVQSPSPGTPWPSFRHFLLAVLRKEAILRNLPLNFG